MLPDLLEVHASHKFVVTIDGIDPLTFTECRLPNLAVKMDPVNEGGQNLYVHQLPGRVEAGTLSLKEALTTDMQLLKWYAQVMAGQVVAAYRNVTVALVAVDNTPIMEFAFLRALPSKWSGISFKAATAELVIQELELVYHGFTARSTAQGWLQTT
ncbi:MAG: phage tail protein [Chloroflexi bacterium]|nr:phage tail protein [Chloroflexota bacterium]